MRGRQSPIESLVTLPRVEDPAERRARWRQAITALGQHVTVHGPPPLDGMGEEELLGAVRAALQYGLIDDVDWIAPGAAAAALFELSACLPPGKERREVGRRVFERLYEGTAATFTPVATRMALGGGKPLDAATMRARVSLVLQLPTGSSVNSDPLALTLVSRREVFVRWIQRSASGPLPARRQAAILLERACREAVRRAQQGDPRPSERIVGETVRPTLDLLLSDREPLVWRHAAVARGLLSAVEPSLRQEVDLALDPGLSPTEWRRAGVSLVACLVGDLETAMSQCKSLLESDIIKRDPGLTATLVWGLPRVIEAEPEAANELLDRLSFTGRRDVAENIAALRMEMANPTFGAEAAERIRSLIEPSGRSDAITEALLEATLRGLNRESSSGGVQTAIRRAMIAYETTGARAAHDLAIEALERAHATMDAIEALSAHGEAGLPEVLAPLADLDASALERSRLYDLLQLGKRPGDANASVPEMDRLYDRLGTWILDHEEAYVESEFSRAEVLARQKRLRALLHLVDVEGTGRAESAASAVRTKVRLRRTTKTLMKAVAAGPDAAVHRIFCATLARTLDAAAREGFADPADLLLLVLEQLTDHHSVQATQEASTNVDIRSALGAYADFLAASSRDAMESIADGSFDAAEFFSLGPAGDESNAARTFLRLSRGLGTNGSYRGEALRQVVLRIGRALENIVVAEGLSELVETTTGAGDPIRELEHHVDALKRLAEGAKRRALDEESNTAFDVVADVPPLSALVERAITGVPPNPTQLAMSIGELTAELPAALAATMSTVLGRIAKLPVSAPSMASAIPLQVRRAELPDWLLPRRTIGGYYVVRALGSGGVSSVFVARRIEERREAGANHYALKVPQYDPNTARSLSEQEFMEMFRSEAGALLSLPEHNNLARFVTYDAAAKPKPILVMELIRGFSLDRLIRNRSLDMGQVLTYFDGILSGLEAMHSVGVGHLDVKPSNVILRDAQTPVLVDFGLSGRQLRPGCGTLEYCSPEVLGVVPEGTTPSVASADMYAFACTAFELLTGDLLFDADDEVTLMTHHVQHDGWPKKLTQLASSPEYANLCVVLAACLRHDPRNRPGAGETRRALADSTKWLADHSWPLRTPETATDLSA